jgi:hypothetical protein
MLVTAEADPLGRNAPHCKPVDCIGAAGGVTGCVTTGDIGNVGGGTVGVVTGAVGVTGVVVGDVTVVVGFGVTATFFFLLFANVTSSTVSSEIGKQFSRSAVVDNVEADDELAVSDVFAFISVPQVGISVSIASITGSTGTIVVTSNAAAFTGLLSAFASDFFTIDIAPIAIQRTTKLANETIIFFFTHQL